MVSVGVMATRLVLVVRGDVLGRGGIVRARLRVGAGAVVAASRRAVVGGMVVGVDDLRAGGGLVGVGVGPLAVVRVVGGDVVGRHGCLRGGELGGPWPRKNRELI